MKPQGLAHDTIAQEEQPVEVCDLLDRDDASPLAGTETLPQDAGWTAAPRILPLKDARYELHRRLGRGSMGEVFAAKDIFLRRRVAFKRMNPDVAREASLAARFLTEAQITAQLDHPNIIPIYGMEATPGGSVGYAMKYIEGRTLTQLLREERDAVGHGTAAEEAHRLADRLRIFTRICDAVSYAHAKGVLHRDLKPDNIMIGVFNQVYVVDWGICRVRHRPDDPLAAQIDPDGDGGTEAGALMGTPAYMAPEQARADTAHIDERSDLFALGLILFEIVTLRQARGGASFQEIMASAAAGRRPPVVHLLPHIPIAAELRAIIHKATAPAPGDRYPDVATLTGDLRRYRNGEAVSALPDTPLRLAMRLISQHRGSTLALLFFLFLVGVGGTLGLQLRAARKAAHERRHRQYLQGLMLAVSRQGRQIDSRLHGYEALLYEVVGRISAAPPGEQAASPVPRVYFAEDFDAGRGPADLQDHPRYGQKISLRESVLQTPAGVRRELISRDIAAMASLDLGAVYRRSGGEIYRLFVTLQSGLHLTYPGRGGFPAGYDGRLRPKFRLAQWGPPGPRWGNAYRGLLNEELLPCAFALRDDTGRFIGVAGFELLISELAARLLPMPHVPAVRQVYLVDSMGHVVARWPGAPEPRRADLPDLKENAALDSPPLPYLPLRQALREETGGGYRELGTEVAAFTPIGTQGWSLVVLAAPEGL